MPEGHLVTPSRALEEIESQTARPWCGGSVGAFGGTCERTVTLVAPKSACPNGHVEGCRKLPGPHRYRIALLSGVGGGCGRAASSRGRAVARRHFPEDWPARCGAALDWQHSSPSPRYSARLRPARRASCDSSKAQRSRRSSRAWSSRTTFTGRTFSGAAEPSTCSRWGASAQEPGGCRVTNCASIEEKERRAATSGSKVELRRDGELPDEGVVQRPSTRVR